MQKSSIFKNSKNILTPSSFQNDSCKPFIKEAFGATSPFALQAENLISEKQIQIMEDAIRCYERLEDIKKFTSLALQEIETVTEDDIKRAVELEKMVSIEDDKAVLALIKNEGFLHDLNEGDFREILDNDDLPDEGGKISVNPDGDLLSDDYFDDFEI